jgi:hypothetical protein
MSDRSRVHTLNPAFSGEPVNFYENNNDQFFPKPCRFITMLEFSKKIMRKWFFKWRS